MSNEAGTSGSVSEALNNLLKNREARRARDRARFESDFGSHRTDAFRYFTLSPSPGSNWVRDTYLGANAGPFRLGDGPSWMTPKRNRLKRIAWYFFDRILVPTLVVAAGILSAIAVLAGMKM